MANKKIHFGMNVSRFLALGLCTMMCSCSIASRSAETEGNQGPASEAGEVQSGLDTNQIAPKCQDAVAQITGKLADKNEAMKACQILHESLLKQYEQYDKLMFTEPPVAPYYFMEAHVEREISPVFVVLMPGGIVPKKDVNAMQAFFKHIDVLHANFEPTPLARMVSAFHAKETETLVTEHQDAESGRPDQNPPSWTKNEDGTATLEYDLQKTGRSTTIMHCIVQIAADEQTTFKCSQKE